MNTIDLAFGLLVLLTALEARWRLLTALVTSVRQLPSTNAGDQSSRFARPFRFGLTAALGIELIAWLALRNESLLVFISILGVLVIAHELGHFAVAKLCRVKVLEFGIGYPPRLFSFSRGDTTYSLNLLPLGGFVRMLGEEDPQAVDSFASKSPWKRLAVLVAGPGMNAALPLLLLTIMFSLPQSTMVTEVAILDVVPGSPADSAGVLPGDIVRAASGREIDNSAELQAAIQLRLGADMSWVVERAGVLVQLRIPNARIDPPPGQGAVGVLLADGRLRVSEVIAGSTASTIGLQEDDLLLRVGESRVLNAGDPEALAIATLQARPSTPVRIDLLREHQLTSLELTPEHMALTGLSVSTRPQESQSLPPSEALSSAFRQTWEILVLFRNEISKWVAGSAAIELSGPVGIAQITDSVLEAGMGPLITWTALLSINLAVINLLPIPALDGGRITFVLLELIRGGRRLAPEKERLVHLVGFLLLLGAIIVVSVNDIQRLISGTIISGQ